MHWQPKGVQRDGYEDLTRHTRGLALGCYMDLPREVVTARQSLKRQAGGGLGKGTRSLLPAEGNPGHACVGHMLLKETTPVPHSMPMLCRKTSTIDMHDVLLIASREASYRIRLKAAKLKTSTCLNNGGCKIVPGALVTAFTAETARPERKGARACRAALCWDSEQTGTPTETHKAQ
jgi:hypothetical protein